MPILKRSKTLTAMALLLIEEDDRLFYASPSAIRSRMSDLILYQRDYCHLCDQALDVLAQAQAPEFDSVWVDDLAALVQRYGTRVPVLRDDRDGRELDWPFDAAAVRAFLNVAD
jgi:hypothetical protein